MRRLYSYLMYRKKSEHQKRIARFSMNKDNFRKFSEKHKNKKGHNNDRND